MINSEIDQFFFVLYLLQLIFVSLIIFVFLLFLGMTMFANKVETRRKNKNYMRDKKLATRNLARSICIIVQFQKISIPPWRAHLLQTPHPPGISFIHCRGCLSQPHTPWNFHNLCTVGGACNSPPAPGICVNFQLGLVTSGKYNKLFVSNILLHFIIVCKR